MALRNIYVAESWEKVYEAFDQVNFTSYDYDTVKESLLQYLKTYYKEHFNDFIESSELIAQVEAFAYAAEVLAYRIDFMSHEQFITTAQRKQSILRLARLISYKPTRNIPVRGLVKIASISSSERILDSQGNNLSSIIINWNDPNNPNWKEQFFLVINRILTNKFGQPQKAFQVGDVALQLYTFNNTIESFRNGVFAFTANTGLEQVPMEIVPIDIDENGAFEREPDTQAQMSVSYATDGLGDGSDFTGFLLFTKQGTLIRIEYNIADPVPNRRIELAPQNINSTDVYLQKIDSEGDITERWVEVETLNEQNLFFNTDRTTRKKYEIESLENDRVALNFADGDFADIPVGTFQIWTRQSINRSVVVQKANIANAPMSFAYTSALGTTETCNLTYSLTSTLQNGAGSETIEHIRQNAPATYYAQNRMVNGQDYNTFPLKDPTILRLKAVNRTFAGQPKYIDWNDASGNYENIKLFGDDLTIKYFLQLNSQNTTTSSRSLVDVVVEPLLSSTSLFNALVHISASADLAPPNDFVNRIVNFPRRHFVEDNRPLYLDGLTGIAVNPYGIGSIGDGSLKEKTAIQGLLDRHWYGEPLSFVTISSVIHGLIPDPVTTPTDDSLIYPDTLPRTIDGINTFPPGDAGSGLQSIADQPVFGLRYNRFLRCIGDGTFTLGAINAAFVLDNDDEVFTLEISTDATTVLVKSDKRGNFPSGIIGTPYATINPNAPFDFTFTQGVQPFEPGDAAVVKVEDINPAIGVVVGAVTQALFPTGDKINLNGWWQLLPAAELATIGITPASGPSSANQDDLRYVTDVTSPYSWLIVIKKVTAPITGATIGWEVHFRDFLLIVESPTTKFWYNEVVQIIDSETKNRVFDKIRILRSNLDSSGDPLGRNHNYDVVGPVHFSDGSLDVNKLQVIPSDALNEPESGDLLPDNVLQFEQFAFGSYEFYDLANPTVVSDDVNDFIPGGYVLVPFTAGAFFTVAQDPLLIGPDAFIGRRLRMPVLSTGDEGLDFMWQHFSPFTNLIDPSPTNIIDTFVITSGYYDNTISFVRGLSSVAPTPPTPLELRNSYGYLLANKMISDTVVFHPGRFKLLFGQLAEPQLRAKFKVVKATTATFTDEKIKDEIITLINAYFDISNWDFGDTFYATELLSLIHQRLPTEIASVVLVPVYAVNSFGSLFTIESGMDEILQTAATVSDVEIVAALTPTVLRQS